MSEIKYLSAEDVIALHDDIIGRMHSPNAPLLHPDKLESAVTRPRNAAYYEEADLVSQAAILALGISQSQAFLDGNKRAAFAAADVFLRINGLAFTGDPIEIARRLESVAEAASGAARHAEEGRFIDWIREQVGPTVSGESTP